jgi:hypothetical protein
MAGKSGGSYLVFVEIRIHNLIEWVNYVERETIKFVSLETGYCHGGSSSDKVYIGAAI